MIKSENLPKLAVFALSLVIPLFVYAYIKTSTDGANSYYAPYTSFSFIGALIVLAIATIIPTIIVIGLVTVVMDDKSWHDYTPIGFSACLSFTAATHKIFLAAISSYFSIGAWKYSSLPHETVVTVMSIWLPAALLACLFFNLMWRWIGITNRARTPKVGNRDILNRVVDTMPTESLATHAEATKAFSHPGGIVIGEYTDPFKDSPYLNPADKKTWGKQGKGPLLTMNPKSGNGHVLVISESAGFKGAGLVIPNLLTYTGPIVLIDPKGDLYERTKAAREAMGRTVIKVDKDDGLDPFRMLKPLIGDRESVYEEIANHLVPGAESHGDMKYFRERSVDILTALLYDSLQSKSGSVPRKIVEFLSGPHEQVLKRLKAVGEASNKAFVKNACERAQGIDKRGFDSFVRPVTNKLKFIEYGDMETYVADPEGSNKSAIALDPMTDIYINIPTRAMRSFEPMIRVLLGNILTGVTIKETVDHYSSNRLILVDEAKGLGNLDVLKDIRDEGRAVGLHLMMFYQTWGTMVDIWGAEVDAWIDGTAVKIFGSVQTEDLAAKISKTVGSTTYLDKSSGSNLSSQFGSIFNGQSGKSESTSLKEVPLISANKIMRMPSHGAIIISRTCKPIVGTKALYFTRKDMKDRLTPVPVKREKEEEEV